jgi:two-component system, cell cycle sensor histidine kinase and response regulator CckA
MEGVRVLGKLEASEDRYRDLIESLDDVVFSLDADGCFQYISPAVMKYGYAPTELIGTHFSQFVHPDDLEALGASFVRTLEGKAEPVAFRAFEKGGKERVVRTSSRVISKAGRAMGMSGVMVDITELRSTEEQLRVAQRAEAVGQLAGGVAHDFNNLLSVILSYAGFVGEAVEGDAQVRADVEEIVKAGTRAAGLTRQLLAFSRKQVLEPQIIEINRLTGDLQKMLHRLIGEDVELVHKLAPDLGRVKADPGQIEQVIMNLVVNARDAMPDGGTLTIETANVVLDADDVAEQPALKQGSFVMLAIGDTGAGMDAITKQRLFEPFYTTKEVGKGTGLGLSTVYGIVMQSGGNIWFSSELGVGTTFKIYLPRVDDAAAVTQRQNTTPDLPRGNETVLLVEDDQAVRALAERVLQGAGYRVLTATDGNNAVTLFKSHPGAISLLLTDVVMPQMNGRQLAQRLLELEPGLRVLYMSGYTDNTIARHGVLEEGTLFIAKPFTAKELARRVRNALDTEGTTA